jgi:hypothetical protein
MPVSALAGAAKSGRHVKGVCGPSRSIASGYASREVQDMYILVAIALPG